MQHAGFKERNVSARPLLRAIIIFIAFHDAYSRTFDRDEWPFRMSDVAGSTRPLPSVAAGSVSEAGVKVGRFM